MTAIQVYSLSHSGPFWPENLMLCVSRAWERAVISLCAPAVNNKFVIQNKTLSYSISEKIMVLPMS